MNVEPGVIAASGDGADADLRVELEDGYAQCMGDGIFIVFKDKDSFVLSADDMRTLLALEL